MHIDSCALSILVLAALALCSVAWGRQSPRVTESMDRDWRFHRGDAPDAQTATCDDGGWRPVDLPHDWSVEDLPALEDPAATAVRSGPFDSEAIGGGAQGYTVGGLGWYRNSFTPADDLRGRCVTLHFDGVYMNCEVWVNGDLVGAHPYGYTAFSLDVTPALRFGEPNVIAVKVDASGKTSRWFPGAGIYRHVWLEATGPVHVDRWGIAVTTPQVSAERATVRAEATIRNEGAEAAEVVVGFAVVGPQGAELASAATRVTVEAGGKAVGSQDLLVEAPELWSPDGPALYQLVTTVTVGDETADRVETPFGIRSIAMDAKNGFVLNGEPMKLRGGCVHHDNGPLGARTYDRAEARRVELLKAAGFNAIRTAHNPPSPAFLDACDRVGMLVLDEAFDCWRAGKNPEDYHRFFDDWWARDMEAMVLRDRNHPCIFGWSIGNEVTEQVEASTEGSDIAAMLAGKVRELDPSRAVGIGAHPGTDPWENLDPLFAHLDLCGYNYKWERYAPDHERCPARVIAGTESFPVQCFESWMATIDNAWVIGDFVWTSFDYLGEVALGHTYYEGDPSQYAEWPWTAAWCGDIDICGLRRPQSLYREIAFGGAPQVACFVLAPVPEGRKELVHGWGWPNEWPSWNWPGQGGKPLTVHVYSSCPQVRLTLNGRDLGVLPTTRETRFTAEFDVPYEAGELVAVGLDGAGNELARWVLQTAGAPASLRLVPDRVELSADGQDLCFVSVEVVDAAGLVDPNADPQVHFSVSGPGSIVAVASSNPMSIESFQQPRRKAWHGRCLVVVKAGEEAGEVRLRAEAEGLAAAETTLRLR